MKLAALLCAIAVSVALGGCASTRRIDTQVSSFATQTVPLGAGYRFERLPSQQAHEPAQTQLETMTEHVLDQHGLRRQDTNAALTVQIASSRLLQRIRIDGGWGLPMGHLSGYPHHPRPLFPGLGTQTLYARQISLIVRDAASHQVLFETHVGSDTPWPDDDAVLPAMLEAALQDFPQPPTGMRRIPIDIPR